MPESREDSVYLAKLAEQAERYEGKSSPFLFWSCALMLYHRDGGKHEACRLVRPGTHRRGT